MKIYGIATGNPMRIPFAGHAPYITDLHQTVYENIYVGHALELLPRLGTHYHLALMIDMFEHLAPEDGRRLLAATEPKAQRILISVRRSQTRASEANDCQTMCGIVAAASAHISDGAVLSEGD